MLGDVILFNKYVEQGRQPEFVICSNLGCLSYHILYPGKSFLCEYCGSTYYLINPNKELNIDSVIHKHPVYYFDLSNSKMFVDYDNFSYLSVQLCGEDIGTDMSVELFCVDNIIDYSCENEMFEIVASDDIDYLWYDPNNAISLPFTLNQNDCQSIADMLNNPDDWQNHCSEKLWKIIKYVFHNKRRNIILTGGEFN